MCAKKRSPVDCRRVELDGVRYVILREAAFEQLCRRAGLEPDAPPEESLETTLGLDHVSLAEKLARRRRVVGLSQSKLARRAGIRPETLNRIERGRTTPDLDNSTTLPTSSQETSHDKKP